MLLFKSTDLVGGFNNNGIFQIILWLSGVW